MACFLKQSTAADIAFGPFLDETTGKDPETTLTITQPDIRLKKNGGAWAQKSAAQTLSHEENGWYEISLSTTDTDTLGILIVAVHESGALPVWREFLVVPANVYDSLILGTDFLQSDLVQWLGTAPLALSSQMVQAVAQSIGASGIGNTAFSTDTGLRNIHSGTCAGVTNGSITLAGGASSVNDFYRHDRIYLTNGTGVGQSRRCTAYNGTTKVATIEPDWATNPVAFTTEYTIREDAMTPAIATGGIVAGSFAANAVTAASIASDTITAAKIAADAITSAKIAAGAIDDDAVAADMDAYHAKVWVVKESTTADHYAVVFFKNGQPVTTGITSPTIQVIKASDGTDLIASGALTEVGALGIYKKDESTNKMAGGAIYFAKVQATIDGSARQWLQQIGRDSV